MDDSHNLAEQQETGRPAIKHWLVLTAAIACILTMHRLMSPKSFYGTMCVLHALTPSALVVCLLGLRTAPLATRVAAVLLILLSSVGVMLGLTAAMYGTDALVWIGVAMLVEWPGQIPFLVVLLLMLRPSPSPLGPQQDPETGYAPSSNSRLPPH